MISLSKKTLAVTTAVFVVAGGSAFAAWTVTTNGVGYLSTSKVETVQFQLSGNPLANVWAGDEAVPVTVQYYNPNPRVINRKVTASVASTSTTACPVSAFTVTPNAQAATLAGQSGWLDVDMPPKIQINADAPDACQGVSVTLSFSLI